MSSSGPTAPVTFPAQSGSKRSWPYIDSVMMLSKTEPTGRNARPVASVATRTIRSPHVAPRDAREVGTGAGRRLITVTPG